MNKSTPFLIWLVPLAAAMLSLFGALEADGIYRGHEVDPVKTPYFTVVLEGIREGIYPAALKEMAEPDRDRSAVASAEEIPPEKSQAEDITAKPETESTEGDKTTDSRSRTESLKSETPALSGLGQAEQTELRREIRELKRGAGVAESEKEDEAGIDVDMELYEIPAESGCPVFDAYDYGIASSQYRGPADWTPVPDTSGMFAPTGPFYELGEVDESYFEDALFIGDSRIDGLCDYGGLEDYATFACRDSLTIYKLFDESLRFRGPKGVRGYATLNEVLSFRSYGKIYLQIGINEIGTGNTRKFYEEYKKVLMKLRASQPLADLYIDGIMHVTASKSSSDPIMNNVNIVERNRAISTLANGRDIFYIDMNPAVCDERGNLLSELSMDNAHLKAAAHNRWHDFLLTHAALK